jgi:hypothetical protein
LRADAGKAITPQRTHRKAEKRRLKRAAHARWGDEVLFKLRHAFFALALLPLTASCSSGPRQPHTVELPGGGPTEAQQREQRGQHSSSFVERMMGIDERPNAGACPLMGSLYEASRIVQFAPADQERYANIAYTGEVRGVRGLCRYVEADPIRMSIAIDFAFGRGPVGTNERKTYRYWVAVARRGVAPLEKQYFNVEVQFRDGQPVAEQTETIETITIPRANNTISGENFEILVGFDLTPAQLQFNRDGKRFRVTAGQGQQ